MSIIIIIIVIIIIITHILSGFHLVGLTKNSVHIFYRIETIFYIFVEKCEFILFSLLKPDSMFYVSFLWIFLLLMDSTS